MVIILQTLVAFTARVHASYLGTVPVIWRAWRETRSGPIAGRGNPHTHTDGRVHLLRLRQHNYVVFDIETTGLYPKKGDRVIKIGAVAVKEGLMVEEFHSLINTPRKISRGAQKVYGITNEMLTRETSPEHVFPKFQVFMNGSVLVAHNARFYMSFLKAEFHRLGLGLAYGYRFTLKLSGKHFPKLTHYSLVLSCWCQFGALPEMNWTRSAEIAK